MRLVLTICLAGFLARPAAAVVLHVPADYSTIGLALAAASSGDEILVGAGTYHEKLTLDASKDGVKIHSESGPAVTILDGDLGGAVVTMTSVGSGTELIGFTIRRGGTATGGGVRLSQASPKIENNLITGNFSFGGAGISAVGGSPLIENNEISGNQTTGDAGGGIYLSGGTPDIENNSIHGNTASGWRGGGIYADGAAGLVRANQIVSNASEQGGGMFVIGPKSPAIQENEFRTNTATNYGGGLFLYSAGTFENNKIIGNVSDVEGGGLYLAGTMTLRGDLIQDNSAPHEMGGGIYMNGASVTFDHEVILRNHGGQGGGISALGSTVSLRNCTIALNSAASAGGNVHLRSQSNLTLQNSIVAFSPEGGVVADASVGAIGFVWITCSDVSNNAAGDYVGLAPPPSANQDIAADPQFCDLANLDLHLGAGSPCVSPQGCLGPMGALPVNCLAVATRPATWGSIKAQYR